MKFGSDRFEAARLLMLAAQQKINVDGLCFNMGYPIGTLEGVQNILKLLEELVVIGVESGLKFRYLDIGGGF